MGLKFLIKAMNFNKKALFTLNVNDISTDRVFGSQNKKETKLFDYQNPEKSYKLNLSAQEDQIKL